jgi:hypothetical protein
VQAEPAVQKLVENGDNSRRATLKSLSGITPPALSTSSEHISFGQQVGRTNYAESRRERRKNMVIIVATHKYKGKTIDVIMDGASLDTCKSVATIMGPQVFEIDPKIFDAAEHTVEVAEFVASEDVEKVVKAARNIPKPLFQSCWKYS